MFVKTFIPKHTMYVASFNDTPYYTDKEYWTTVDVEDTHNVHWIKHLARENLSKRIAQTEFCDIKYYKHIWLDVADIQIVQN